MRAYAAASDSRTQRTTSAGDPGTRRPAARQARRIRSGMSPGAMNASSSTSISGPPAGSAAACVEQRLQLRRLAALAQSRSDSDSSHSPPTLRRNRMRPSTPPSLVKFAARLASVSTGASSSSPTSDQVPEET